MKNKKSLVVYAALDDNVFVRALMPTLQSFVDGKAEAEAWERVIIPGDTKNIAIVKAIQFDVFVFVYSASSQSDSFFRTVVGHMLEHFLRTDSHIQLICVNRDGAIHSDKGYVVENAKRCHMVSGNRSNIPQLAQKISEIVETEEMLPQQQDSSSWQLSDLFGVVMRYISQIRIS